MDVFRAPLHRIGLPAALTCLLLVWGLCIAAISSTPVGDEIRFSPAYLADET